MEVLKGLNAIVAFGLEMAMLVSFGYWGYQVGQGTLARWALAIGLPTVAIVIWGLYFAPKATRRLSILPGALLSLGLFVLGAFALYQTKQTELGIAIAIIALVNRILVLVWKQW